MGLAASQARLLSITSRMSDNELRSQLISNAKMRLATDSSNVSNEYIAALNETQLMFSNYNSAGDEQNQVLNFNNLTAYSSYNNQYGIVNNNGKLLVSTTDANNFENSSNLDEFLEKYGLEYTTTYFDKYKNDPVYYYDQYGRYIESNITVGEMQEIFEGNVDSVDENGILHYGFEDSYKSREYGAYELLLGNYNTARETYQTELKKQQKAWFGGDTEVYSASAGKYIRNLVGNQTFEYYMNKVTSLNVSNIESNKENYLNVFKEFYNNTKLFLDPQKSSTYQNTIETLMAVTERGLGSKVYEFTLGEKPTGLVKINDDGSREYIPNPSISTHTYSSAPTDGASDGLEGANYPITVFQYNYDLDDDSYSTLYYKEVSEEYYNSLSDSEKFIGDGTNGIASVADAAGAVTNHYYAYCIEGEGGVQYNYPSTTNYDGSVETSTVEAEDILNALQELYSYYRDNTVNNLASSYFESKNIISKDLSGNEVNSAVVYEAKQAYIKAANALAKFIYGQDNLVSINSDGNVSGILKDYVGSLGDLNWVLSLNWDIKGIKTFGILDDNINDGITNDDHPEKSHYNPFADIDSNENDTVLHTTFLTDGNTTYIYLDNLGNIVNAGDANATAYPLNFQVVKDIYLMEQMLDVYGEPKYTWIDKNDENENATAKAQWYSNLYARMQDGYATLDEALTKSSEWMQFAFESGLVHMEQVDKSNTWVSTTYANCSNITEQTVNIDTTIAEAKYQREMNKIEAKDQQYDLELKNIDTEHSSLEQEYESIKSVISKNIERNYKLFQQG